MINRAGRLQLEQPYLMRVLASGWKKLTGSLRSVRIGWQVGGVVFRSDFLIGIILEYG
jgi:hypothetical protein